MMESKEIFVRGLSIVLVISMVFGSIPYFTMASETVGQIDIEMTGQELVTYDLAVSEIEVKEIIPDDETQGVPAPNPFATFEIMYADSAIDQDAGAVPEATGSPDDVRFSFGGNANYVRASGSTWGAGAGSILSVEIAAEWTSSGLTDDGAIIQYYDAGTSLTGATASPVDANNYAVDNTLYVDITADKASWTWTDVGNINPEIYYFKAGGPDGGTLGIDALWIRVQYESISIDFDVPVTAGWNLISVPSVQGNTDINSVLDDAGGDTTWERASHYNPLIVDNLWQTYSILKPASINELNDVNNKLGVWVYITDIGSDGLLTMSGSPPSMTAINLYTGWNLVGYPCLESQIAMNTLAGVPYDALECYDGGAPYLLRTMLDTEIMNPGVGYWIKVSANCVWNVGDITPPTFAGLDSALDAGTGGSVLLNWNPATDPSYPITYNIYMATTSGGQNFGTPDYTTDQTNFQVDGLTDNQDYYFVVRAEDSAGNEDTNLVEKTAMPTTPDVTSPWIDSTVPTDTATGVALGQSIIITFSESINTGTFAYTCTPNPGGWGETWDAAVEANDRVTLTHNDLAFDTVYTFQVTAADDLAGNPLVAGPAPNPWTFTTIAAPDITGPVTSLVSVTPDPTDGAATVTLTATVDDSTTGGSTIAEAEYFVDSVGADGTGTAMAASDGNFNAITEDVTVSIDVSGWALGTYTLYVHGRDSSGNWGVTASTTLDVTDAPDIISPWIVTTAPVDAATGVVIGQSIVITFSESINTGTLAYTCTPNPGGWGETWDAAVETNDRVTLTHTDFAFDTLYDFQVTAADDLAGNPLAAGPVPNPWTFTTEIGPTPPQVVEPTSPANGAVDVLVTSNIQITFTEAMNEVSVESWFNINPATAGTFSWNPPSTILTFTPSGDLANDQAYTITIDGLAEDQQAETLDGDYDSVSEGSPADDYSFSFTTATAPDLTGPVTSGIDVTPNPTDGAATVTLTATVDDSTTGGSNIAEAEYFVDSVGADGTGTAMAASDGTFNAVSEGVTISIDVSGWADGTYTLYVHGRDSAGNWGATISIVLDVTSAPDTIPPQVVSNTPADGATGVVISSNIIVQFTEEMDQANTEGAFGIVPAVAGTFSWNPAGDTLTFNPSSDLAYATIYTVTILTAATDLAGNTLDGDKDGNMEADNKDKWVFSFTTELEPTPPQVVEPTSPAGGAIDVDITSNIQITFTEAMNEASVESWFTISPAVAGAFSWNIGSTILTFTPSVDLANDQVYTVKIDGLAEDQQAETLDGDYSGTSDGSPADDYSFSFTTITAPDLTGPVTSGVSVTPDPTDGAGTVTLTANVDDSTTGGSNIAEAEYFVDTVGADGTGTAMAASDGNFNAVSEGVTATIDVSGWAVGTYTLYVHGRDSAGNWGVTDSTTLDVTVLADTTPPQVVSNVPADGAVGIAVNTNIVVTFNEEMDQANTEGAFEIVPAVAGTFSWNAAGTIMTFNPSSDLAGETTYTVTIHTTATDLAGNTLDGDKDGNMEADNKDKWVFGFTTIGTLDPPQVVEPTAPFNGEGNVAMNANIVITFTESMNEASVESYFSISPAAAGSFSWNPAGTIMTFNPNPDLSATTTYTVTIDGLATDLEAETLDGDYDGTSEGSPTDDYSFSFTTETGPINKYAVVVGINKFDFLSDLTYCVADANEVKTNLAGDGYSVDIITDGQATKAGILSALDDLVASEVAGDYTAFTFSGHGGIISGKCVICPTDGNSLATYIQKAELETKFSAFDSTHHLVFFDSCNSGGMSTLGSAGRLCIMAAKSTQYSWDGQPDIANGVWTYFFWEDGYRDGMAGTLILEDVFTYAAPLANTYVETNYPPYSMNAQITDGYTGDFYL